MKKIFLKIKILLFKLRVAFKKFWCNLTIKKPKKQDGKVAIVTGGGLGDAVLFLPYVNAVKTYYEAQGKEVYLIADVVTYDFCKTYAKFEEDKSIKFISDGIWEQFYDRTTFVKYLYKNTKNLRKHYFEKVINFCHHQTNYANRQIIKGLFAKEIIGSKDVLKNDNDDIANFYTQLIKVDAKNQLNMYYVFTKMLGIDCQEEMFYLKQFVKDNNEYKKVVFCIGASTENRKWAKDKWAELGNHILSSTKEKIIFVGGGKERAFAEDVLSNFADKDRAVNLCGKTSLQDLIDILGNCKTFVAQDSGPAHIASCVGAKGVVLLGGGMGNIFFPHVGTSGQTDNLKIVCNKQECWGCWWNCTQIEDKTDLLNKNVPCIEGITVEQVIKEIDQIIL